MRASGAIDYCRTLIAAGDEDFRLTLPYALPDDRPRLAAVFAFMVELRRIPNAVSEPPLGEIRLQWWREALAEIAGGDRVRAHPVVGALRETNAFAGDNLAVADRLIEARARLLYERRFSALEDLSQFLCEAEAPVIRLALGEFADEATIVASEAYALARFAPSHAPKLAAAACGAAKERYAGVAPSLRNLPPRGAGRAAFLALAPGYAARPGGDRWSIGKRAALFRAMLTGRF